MAAIILVMVILSFIFGPIISLVITPFVSLLRKIFIVPFYRKKLLNKAIADGHIVTAKLVKSYDETYSDDFGVADTGREIGLYTYEYNGKTYKYRAVTTAHFPKEMELYFVKKPGKACMQDEIGLRESNWIKLYLSVTGIIIIVIFIVGTIYLSSIL